MLSVFYLIIWLQLQLTRSLT